MRKKPLTGKSGGNSRTAKAAAEGKAGADRYYFENRQRSFELELEEERMEHQHRIF